VTTHKKHGTTEVWCNKQYCNTTVETYLEAADKASAITIAVFEEISARRAFPSPNRFPRLAYNILNNKSVKPNTLHTAQRSPHQAQMGPEKWLKQKQEAQIA